MDQVCPKRMNIIQGRYIKLWKLNSYNPKFIFYCSVGSSNSSHSNSRGKEERLETHIESEIPDEEEDIEQEKRIPDRDVRVTKSAVSSNEQQTGKASNFKQIQNRKEGLNASSPSVSPSKSSTKVLSPSAKMRGNLIKLLSRLYITSIKLK